MKTSLSFTKFASLLAATGALTIGVLSGGCAATSKHESTGQYVDDAVITTKVKAALLTDDAVKSFAVGVETVNHVVQLSGFVNTAAQKAAAGADAQGVENVREVRNNLIVK